MVGQPLGAKGILPGPKLPGWACPKCGANDNWSTRPACRACGNCAPAFVFQAAAKAAEARAAQPATAKTMLPQGKWAQGLPKSVREDQRAKTQTEPSQSLRKELEDLKKYTAKLDKTGRGQLS